MITIKNDNGKSLNENEIYLLYKLNHMKNAVKKLCGTDAYKNADKEIKFGVSDAWDYALSVIEILKLWKPIFEEKEFYILTRDCYGQPSGDIQIKTMTYIEAYEEFENGAYIFDDYNAACIRALD